MLTKFESKSNRVKGLSFHNKRPWILASLHNGVIQLWDYRMGTLLQSYEEHDGPVRGIDFHKSQPLFCSGGDDYKVKVFNYKLGRCLFTLLGHLDYIRTAKFHHEYPWIVTASDDQTLRIWNWQSRSSISVLTGHNHYVMSASFHPKDDLVVSASLDQTVRVWDTSGLRKKTVRGAPQEHDASGNNAVMSRVNADLFGGADAIVKYVLDGHERGVNWAEFHHTLPLIISGADDRQIKLWRMNETKAWEVDTMRGHTNNVSCVIFHPKQDLFVSNSEDRSIRVWDITRRQGIQTFRRENDRFWILASHPEQNLLAAGHDSGMIVFKLRAERPAYDNQSNTTELYYVKDRYLRRYDYGSSEDSVQVSLQRPSNGGGSALGNAPRSLVYNSFNPQEINVLVLSDADGGSYELVALSSKAGAGSDVPDSKRGQAIAGAFIARNKFIVLDRSRQLQVKNMRNEVTKRFPAPYPMTDGVFPAGVAGRVLLRSEDRVTLFDTQSRKVVSDLVVANVRYVVWSADGNLVALLCKHAVILCNKNLEQQCTVTETVRVKSGAWGMSGVFVYATLNHIKYCIANGDSGVVRTLDLPVYITRVTKDTLYCLDREVKVRTLSIDMTECMFKVALMRKQYGQVISMIRHSSLCGHAIIAYLQQKGYPEVALHFVEDKKTRFNLAIECGNLEIAQAAALELDDKECWAALGAEALRQGNHKVVEMSYQCTRDLEKLSFLYLITGNRVNLTKMLKIAEKRGDVMSRFHNALYMGDAEEKVNILEEVGQLSLAYVAAVSHGLGEAAERIRAKLEEAEVEVPSVDPSSAGLLVPPNPIQRSTEENWPLLAVTQSAIQEFLEKGGTVPDEAALYSPATGGSGVDDGDVHTAGSGFEDDDDGFDDDDLDDGMGDAWGGDDDDLDLGLDDGPEETAGDVDDGFGDDGGMQQMGVFVAPVPGPDKSALWVQNSSLAADHVAAGSFESAMKLLNRQIGVTNFAPLKDAMVATFLGSRVTVPGMSGATGTAGYLQRNDQNQDPGSKSLPHTIVQLKSLVDQVRGAYKLFQRADSLAEARNAFLRIITAVPMVVVERAATDEVKEVLNECREYILGISMELERRSLTDKTRQTELAALFTCCKLQPMHLMLVLNQAMVQAFKLNNFITAASFAQRLLNMREINSPSQAALKTKATKVLRKSEENARNEKKLDYPEQGQQFSICSVSHRPILLGQPSIKCPYCAAVAKPEHAQKLCPICTLSPLGVETIGLVCSQNR